ncbi:MAG: hypothetical protein R8M45_07805 [Ghiorsea sp.]
MSINEVVRNVTDNVEGALGCAIVDLSSGLLLGVYHTVPYFTQAYIDAVGAAAVDLFRGNNVRTVEKLLADHRGEATRSLIKEVQMTTDGTYHFMIIVPGKPEILMVLITSKKANLGMGWVALRSASKEVAPYCP